MIHRSLVLIGVALAFLRALPAGGQPPPIQLVNDARSVQVNTSSPFNGHQDGSAQALGGYWNRTARVADSQTSQDFALAALDSYASASSIRGTGTASVRLGAIGSASSNLWIDLRVNSPVRYSMRCTVRVAGAGVTANETVASRVRIAPTGDPDPAHATVYSSDGVYEGVFAPNATYTIDALAVVSSVAGAERYAYFDIEMSLDAATAGCVPSVVLQPPGIVSVVRNGTALFGLTASSPCMLPVSYQWQRDGVDLADSARVWGTRSNFLTLTAIEPRDLGTYRCVVRTDSGSVLSGPVDVRLTCSIADVASVGGAYRGDSQVTVDDIVLYLNGFFAVNIPLADVAGLGGVPVPDGQVTTDDLVRFLAVFFSGCP